MSMICNRCKMLTEPMGHTCEFCGECVGGDKCPTHTKAPNQGTLTGEKVQDD